MTTYVDEHVSSAVRTDIHAARPARDHSVAVASRLPLGGHRHWRKGRVVPRGATAFDPRSLRAARHERHLTLRELGERVGLTTWHVAKLEAGRHAPSVALIKPLADALQIPVEQLLLDPVTFAFLRARAGKTQAELASQLGISEAAVGRIETGSRLRLPDELVRRIAEVLGCTEAAVRTAHRAAK